MKKYAVLILLWCGLAIVANPQENVEEQADSEDTSAMTEEEVEAELKRIEESVNEGIELEEFKPSKPLPADAPIALPSDI
jgi:hypothetical protein